MIATLAVTIAREAFLPAGRFDPVAVAIAVAGFILAWRFKVSPLWLVIAGAGLGILRGVLG